MNREERRAELRKHGDSHDEKDHGNWARGAAGRVRRAASRMTVPGRSLQREMYPSTISGHNAPKGNKAPKKAAPMAHIEGLRSIQRLTQSMPPGHRVYARGYINVLTGKGDIQRVRQRAADNPDGPNRQDQIAIESKIDHIIARSTGRRRKA